MVRMVLGSRHSYLVGAETDVRSVLRRAGIRYRSCAWKYIVPPPWVPYRLYRVAGDDHWRVRQLRLPMVSWGQLALDLVQKWEVR